jgi:hypothetical protein
MGAKSTRIKLGVLGIKSGSEGIAKESTVARILDQTRSSKDKKKKQAGEEDNQEEVCR